MISRLQVLYEVNEGTDHFKSNMLSEGSSNRVVLGNGKIWVGKVK